MDTPLGRLIIYTHKLPEMIEFYCSNFGFTAIQLSEDRIVELRPQSAGSTILLHPASKGKKLGQTLVKLVFDVRDVEAFCQKARENGLEFGSLHRAQGYVFANAKDPSGNSVSVSSRAFAD